ncbi:MAG TPA: DUF6348 family protein [Kofleriaceae bacterium]
MTPTDIARWTAGAFRSNPAASDDAIAALLVGAGVPSAWRAIAMLPLAFGRRLLAGATLSETYIDGETEHVLADDPLYAAAVSLAATSTDIEAIGLRSSEVDAANQALHKGGTLEHLVFSPPFMQISDEAEVTLPPEVQPLLESIVRAHGSELAWEARLFPGAITTRGVQLQLDFVAAGVIESFGGYGTTIATAIDEAFGKFKSASLHPMLAGLERRELGGEQVEWETWGNFDVCMGPLLRLWNSDGEKTIGGYLDALKAKLLAANLAPERHWVRTFIATDGTKEYGLDMLLDNQAWAPGVELARGWPWAKADRAYALRHFFMLLPRAS